VRDFSGANPRSFIKPGKKMFRGQCRINQNASVIGPNQRGRCVPWAHVGLFTAQWVAGKCSDGDHTNIEMHEKTIS
jgi:hypothetical protein